MCVLTFKDPGQEHCQQVTARLWLVPVSSQIRTELEMQMVCNLREFKEFIDNEMINILGQMDSPTEIFEHVFLVWTLLCFA